MKTYPKQRAVGLAATAFAALLGSSAAQAVDFDGYFRAGPGGSSKNTARACYNLGIDGGHYRLGNECDFYGEFGFAQTATVDGVTFKGKVMINEYNGGTDTASSSAGFNQMYVEGKGFDIAPDTNFWIGKRFYGRSDVHILDQFFVNLDGVGAGADNIALAGGKFGIAYFGTDGSSATNPALPAYTKPGSRVNADLSDIPVNPGGTLRVLGTFTNGNFDAGKQGFGLTLQHKQDITSIGGANTAWLQYAQGSAGLNGNFGNLTTESGVKSYRIVDSATWQAGPFGGQAVALYGHKDQDGLTPAFGEVSVGGRGSYAVTKNFKFVGELGYMEKTPENLSKQKLAKATLAAALSTGPGFWNRPELRLYVTTAKWNDAANAAAGPNGLTGQANGKNTGTSYGAQVEIWF